MKVKELIAELSKCPPESEVKIEDSTGWDQDIQSVGAFNGVVVIDMVPR